MRSRSLAGEFICFGPTESNSMVANQKSKLCDQVAAALMSPTLSWTLTITRCICP